MKKIFNLLIISVMLMSILLAFTGCGNNKKGETTSNNEISNSTTTNSNNSNTENKTGQSTQSNTLDYSSDSNYYNWDYLKLYLPKWLKWEDVYGYNVYSGSLNTTDKIYYHFASSGYYDQTREDYIEGYNYLDAPKIIGYSLDKVVYEFYPYFKDKYSISVEKEETVKCNGYNFIKRSGIIHSEKYADKGEVVDLNYVAYYGCMDMKMFDGRSVPMMWAAFSEVTDEKTLEDMEMLVDTAANNMKFEYK